MRSSSMGSAGLLALSVLAILPFGFAACGGEETKPPVTAAAKPLPARGPSGAAAPATVHAGVSGAAKGSYDRGYAAFMAGDLAAAKQAFTDASHADPQAPAPLCSLGAVLEHLGDVERRAATVQGCNRG